MAQDAPTRLDRTFWRLAGGFLIAAFALVSGPHAASAQTSSEFASWNATQDVQDSPSVHTVRVQLKWRHQFQFAGYYAAIEQGYYRDIGLDVKLIEYSPGITPIDQLMRGNVDFAVADTGALIYRSTGVPLVALAAIFQHSPSILISREDSVTQTLRDFRYKRMMLSGGYMNAELMAMLQNAGVRIDEIQLVPDDTSINALIENRTDAYNGYTTNEPYFLKKRGVPFQVFRPREYGVDFYGDTLFTTEAKVVADPELVDGFRQATLKGWTYAVEHPEETVDLILAKYNTQNKSRDHLLFEAEESIKLILPNVVPIGYMNAERWQRIEDTFKTQGRLGGTVDLRQFIYPSDEIGKLMDILHRHKSAIAGGGVLIVGILLLSHILSLRVQIRARTRELEDAKQRAEHEARTDDLTGLPNRRHFIEGTARDIAHAERQGNPLSVIVADIDFFKNINDRFGHAAGDEALKRAAEVLKRNVRSGDIAARIGGEEFALSCLDAPVEETHTLAERLRQEIEKTPITFDGETFFITFSLGVALHRTGQTLDDVLHNADLALYAAKQDGRNRVCQDAREA